MNRRSLLSGLATSVVTPLVMSEILREAFTIVLDGEISVEEWQDRVESYGHDFIVLGGNGVSARLTSDLIRLRQRSNEPATCSVAAKLMTFYGKSLPIYDNAKEAVQWYRLAAVMADRSEDLPTRVWVRGMSALALAHDVKQLPMAHLLSSEALALTDIPSAGRVGALIAQAHIAGARGQQRASIQLMEQTEQAFEATGAAGEVSDFAVPEWRYWLMASLLYSRLGDEVRGPVAQEQACRTLPARISRYARNIELHRGLMLAKAGDRRGGLDHAMTAFERMPPEYRSVSARLMLAEIERG